PARRARGGRPGAARSPHAARRRGAGGGRGTRRRGGRGAGVKPAVFFDRDGTLIEDPGYLSRAGQVRLLPGAAGAVRAVNDAGRLAVVVTNQSGIARGLLTEADYAATAARLGELLAAEGARLD